ncbi:uracil-DNA glycosylase [Aliiruegeria lutimaris]|uniref:Uracil-DNA glycosylase n=1 Tax=Aliiruegeria lutimaris TaxID=571298 RepID=A0A1G8ZFH7_9RHOB|nr:uracil-DNA glycosylase [Aliiruegeria lutimaris]SDK13859.1 Uracil-DNA glycosylase [Aliiruegeria lutimaris]
MTLGTTHIGAWAELPFFREDLPAIADALEAEQRQVLPAPERIFAALEMTQPEQTRVVILGQDPYPTPGHAHGLAFSAEADVRPLPRSLGNIYKEMRADLGDAPDNADLRFWARQGVLLLNAVLTVPAGEANGHKALGWQTLTAQVLERLSDTPRVFLLWGRPAQKAAAKSLRGEHHLRIETAHPSPLSASRGFFGSRPFSRANNWLQDRGHTPINWMTPEAA